MTIATESRVLSAYEAYVCTRSSNLMFPCLSREANVSLKERGASRSVRDKEQGRSLVVPSVFPCLRMSSSSDGTGVGHDA